MMMRKWFLLCVVVAFAAGCGSEDKKSSEEAMSKATGETGEVTATDITFDPMGSDSGNIPGLSTINFEYDKARLTTEARRLLSENAEWIRSNGGANIQIEGHCDERGTVEYNLALGQRRADAVRDYLVNMGVDAARLSVLSYGEEKPVANGSDEAAWAQNRRANFVPLPR